jgi:hypothetical protein
VVHDLIEFVYVYVYVYVHVYMCMYSRSPDQIQNPVTNA